MMSIPKIDPLKYGLSMLFIKCLTSHYRHCV